jgi:hypothetical protein
MKTGAKAPIFYGYEMAFIFRTDSDIVQAVNASIDLKNLVIEYLMLWQKYAQDLNGVHVPTDPFTVEFLPMEEERVRVKLIYTKTRSHQEAVYYDVDHDNYSESWGASNVSHHVTKFTRTLSEHIISIHFSSLLRSKENMIKDIQAFAEREKKRLQEVERQSKIAAHQEAIRKLEEQT